jgi:4-hydroxy-tetrahydrodipicolinate reductase
MQERRPANPLRVVQWATGNIGTRSLRSVIEHPDLVLVGVYVYDPDKVGVDAGRLCGLDDTGVVATAERDEICALGADCVLYMPRLCDLADVCALLSSGANVVTTRGEFHRPASMPPDDRARVEAACEQGGTSIHSTGSSPGFISEAVPLVLTSIQRRLDLLTIDEYADLSQRDSPELLFDLMGFGQPPGEIDPNRAEYLRHSFGPSLELVAEALSLPLDRVEAHGEVAAARKRTEIAAGTLEAGTVAGQRTTVSGLRDGRPLLRFRATWFCTPDLDADWSLGPTGWHVSVEGDAPLEVDLVMPADRLAEITPGYTAHRAVNLVPSVCAAATGIRTSVDLPQVVATLGG